MFTVICSSANHAAAHGAPSTVLEQGPREELDTSLPVPLYAQMSMNVLGLGGGCGSVMASSA